MIAVTGPSRPIAGATAVRSTTLLLHTTLRASAALEAGRLLRSPCTSSWWEEVVHLVLYRAAPARFLCLSVYLGCRLSANCWPPFSGAHKGAILKWDRRSRYRKVNRFFPQNGSVGGVSRSKFLQDFHGRAVEAAASTLMLQPSIECM
jgi:hypothetical protein